MIEINWEHIQLIQFRYVMEYLGANGLELVSTLILDVFHT